MPPAAVYCTYLAAVVVVVVLAEVVVVVEPVEPEPEDDAGR